MMNKIHNMKHHPYWHFLKHYMWPSFYEALFVLFVSNASILALILMFLLNTEGAQLSFMLVGEVITSNAESSEILVYILALVAPAAWIMISHWQGRRHFVFYWLLLIIQAAIVFGSAVIYSVSKSTGVNNNEFADNWAIVCFGTGATIWYITLVYEKWIPRKIDRLSNASGNSVLNDLESNP